MKKGTSNPRLAVLDVLANVLQRGESLSVCLPSAQLKLKDPTQAAYVQAISNGVLRDYYRLQALLSKLIQQPLKERDQDIVFLLLVGLHELIEQRSPDYAIVSELVELAVGLRKQWAKRLINGVLRNFIRQREDLQQKVDEQFESRFACPMWLIEWVKRDWPQDWEVILAATREQAPMILRVNLNELSREEYIAQLKQIDIEATSMNEAYSAVKLSLPCDVRILPGFTDGKVSVQDAAAQWAAVLLGMQENERVLDACAAPGGKTLHILQQQPHLAELVAVELSEQRAQRIRENIQRGRIDESSVKIVTADVSRLADWWDGKSFERVLLDAPCSASGVIRRHPDIKVLRRESDIVQFAETQERLLKQLWQVLAENGTLLYCTCSLFRAENEDLIKRFIAETVDCVTQPLNIPMARSLANGYQFLPGINNSDGFYYAAMRKRKS